MNDIPALAWVAIVCIVTITLLVNLALVLMLRNPSQMRNLKMPRDQHQRIDLLKAVNTMRDPFREERNQINELSHLVNNLDTPADAAESKEGGSAEPLKKNKHA